MKTISLSPQTPTLSPAEVSITDTKSALQLFGYTNNSSKYPKVDNAEYARLRRMELAKQLELERRKEVSSFYNTVRQIDRQEQKVVREQTTIPTPAGDAFNFPSPLFLLTTLGSPIRPHPWQVQMLNLLGGYLTPGSISTRDTPTPETPMILGLPCANGSGKDQILIATFAIWFALTGKNNRVIITTASQDQMKRQTEPYIQALCELVNTKFGKIFETIQFYKKCIRTGSEIQMFVTDEGKLAEGYHPWPGGKMALIVNEAKSVPEEIFDALTRCTGYSYWIEISSPGDTSGHFYRTCTGQQTIQWPEPCKLGVPYFRRISAFDCPHLPKSHIDRCITEMEEWWVQSSIYANFCSFSTASVITAELWERALHVAPCGDDIGIGADLAAGGDENSIYVRRGNRIVDEFHFTEKDTESGALLIDRFLDPYKSLPYSFKADDGGIGRAIIDKLKRLGWKIHRVLNNSAAYDKTQYLNLGAEMYFRVKRLIANNKISRQKTNPKVSDSVLTRQLTLRRYDQLAGGKFRLEDKKAARSRTKESPDRADAFVLCFYSYRPAEASETKVADVVRPSVFEFGEQLAWGRVKPQTNVHSKHRTYLTGVPI